MNQAGLSTPHSWYYYYCLLCQGNTNWQNQNIIPPLFSIKMRLECLHMCKIKATRILTLLSVPWQLDSVPLVQGQGLTRLDNCWPWSYIKAELCITCTQTEGNKVSIFLTFTLAIVKNQTCGKSKVCVFCFKTSKSIVLDDCLNPEIIMRAG